MAEKKERTDGGERQWLAGAILLIAGLGIIALSIVVIVLCPHEQRFEATKYVFVADLPLLGSWVGTVLAYYFSQNNLSAATRSVVDIQRNAVRPAEDQPIVVGDNDTTQADHFLNRQACGGIGNAQ